MLVPPPSPRLGQDETRRAASLLDHEVREVDPLQLLRGEDGVQPGVDLVPEGEPVVQAVQLLEGRQVVFIRSGATEFRVRPVTVGRLSGRLVEITEGLAAGDLVVTTGAFKLKSALLAGTLGDDDDDEAKESQR